MPAAIRVLRCRIIPRPLSIFLRQGRENGLIDPGDLLWLEGREKPVLIGDITKDGSSCLGDLWPEGVVTHIACIDLDALEAVDDLKGTRR